MKICKEYSEILQKYGNWLIKPSEIDGRRRTSGILALTNYIHQQPPLLWMEWVIMSFNCFFVFQFNKQLGTLHDSKVFLLKQNRFHKILRAKDTSRIKYSMTRNDKYQIKTNKKKAKANNLS